MRHSLRAGLTRRRRDAGPKCLWPLFCRAGS